MSDRRHARLLLTENITADGRIEMIDDWVDPSPEGDTSDWLAGMDRLGASSDAALVGRETFEDFRGYWPRHTDEQAGAYLDGVQKYVVSSSITDPQWHRSTILSCDPGRGGASAQGGRGCGHHAGREHHPRARAAGVAGVPLRRVLLRYAVTGD